MEEATKYNSDYCNDLIKYSEEGNSVKTWCLKVRISRETFYQWVKVHQEFKQASYFAYLTGLKYWEDKLIFCIDHEIPTAGIIFVLKTRFHREYGDPDKIKSKDVKPIHNVHESYDQYIRRLHEAPKT